VAASTHTPSANERSQAAWTGSSAAALATMPVPMIDVYQLGPRWRRTSLLAAEVMTATPIGSPMLRVRIPLLLDRPEQAWFDIAMAHKDIRLAREAADELRIALPSAAVADEMLTKAQELGYAHRDLAALHELLAK
jgi:hypothetical protein